MLRNRSIFHGIFTATILLSLSACGTKAAADAAEDAGVSGNQTNEKQDVVVDVGDQIRACKANSECKTGEQCFTVDGATAFCRVPTSAAGMGDACYLGQKCNKGLKCVGDTGSVRAVCSASCESNLDCPSSMWCFDRGDGTADGHDGKYCMPRRFGASCVTDEHCASGVCTDMGVGTKFCSKTCDVGSTECPRYADCTEQLAQDGISTRDVCTHRKGYTIGDGSLCEPCTDHACAKNDAGDVGQCLTFGSGENFCTFPCTSAAECGSGYKCSQTSANGKSCIPVANRCVGKLSKIYQKGDIFEDYAMIGRTDTNGDGKLSDEEPQVIKLSDFADKDLIGITISAGWCVPCQQETKTFASTMKTYGDRVMIFQVLIEDDNQGGGNIDVDYSLAWIKQFGVAGTSGIDPDHTPDLWNEAGSIPLNILIDAKTRKVLEKENGAGPDGWVTMFKAHLK